MKRIMLGTLVGVTLFWSPILMRTASATPGFILDLMCDGEQSQELNTLHPRLQKKIIPILQQLTEEGFEFSFSTYRSPERQQCLYNIGQTIQAYTGQKGFTTITKSCHNYTKNGLPAALAIDIHSRSLSRKKQADFYLRLRSLSVSAGLVSGGNFSQSNPIWATYGLGWDPGHVQVANCTSRRSS